MFCRSVTSAVPRAYFSETSAIARSCARLSRPPSMRTRSMKYLSSRSSGSRIAGLAAVDPGAALGVQAPPAEAAAQVGAVDGVEAAVGVDVLDAGPHVQAVVVLLGLLVAVQRSEVALGPLALAALLAGSADAGRRGRGGGHVGRCPLKKVRTAGGRKGAESSRWIARVSARCGPYRPCWTGVRSRRGVDRRGRFRHGTCSSAWQRIPDASTVVRDADRPSHIRRGFPSCGR